MTAGNRKLIPAASIAATTLDSEPVYGAVKAKFDHPRELSGAQSLTKCRSLACRSVATGVPYHEGAIRCFQEKKVWAPEAQTYQDRMIKRRRN